MSGRLQGKSAIVFGSARGIGAGIAARFAGEGANIVIADIESEAGETTAQNIGGSFVEASVANRDDVEGAVKHCLDRFGKLDILVQNAGIYPWNLIENISDAEWDQVLAVNLKSAFLTARAVLVPMKAQAAGRMIFISSITGPRVTSPGHGHYSASKAGINGFIRAAALEFSAYGITVNGIEPGNIMTEGMQLHRSAEYIRSMAESIPLGRLGSVQDVANAGLFLASDEASYITGTTILVDGGQTLPEGKDFRAAKQG